MEWIFISNWNDTVGEILREKQSYKICSFSGEKWFRRPTMRCHYANSFKWVVIQIEVDENEVKKIIYDNQTIESWNAKEILTRKSKARKYEDEYRYLEHKFQEGTYEIWKITAIYFWDPYHNISNRYEVTSHNKNIKEYEDFKNKIIKEINQNLELKKMKKRNVFFKNWQIRIKKIDES